MMRASRKAGLGAPRRGALVGSVGAAASARRAHHRGVHRVRVLEDARAVAALISVVGVLLHQRVGRDGRVERLAIRSPMGPCSGKPSWPRSRPRGRRVRRLPRQLLLHLERVEHVARIPITVGWPAGERRLDAAAARPTSCSRASAWRDNAVASKRSTSLAPWCSVPRPRSSRASARRRAAAARRAARVRRPVRAVPSSPSEPGDGALELGGLRPPPNLASYASCSSTRSSPPAARRRAPTEERRRHSSPAPSARRGDRLALRLEIACRRPSRRADRDDALDQRQVHQRLERLHPARAAADDGVEAAHAEVRDEQVVQPHRVAQRGGREIGAVPRARRARALTARGAARRRPVGISLAGPSCRGEPGMLAQIT